MSSEKMTAKDRRILNAIREHCLAALEYKHLADHMAKNLGTSDNGKLFASMYYDGLLMQLAQIGEKANRLSDEFVADSSDQVPWSKIIGMRNILIHRYDDINYGIVDRVVNHELVPWLNFCSDELGLERPTPE